MRVDLVQDRHLRQVLTQGDSKIANGSRLITMSNRGPDGPMYGGNLKVPKTCVTWADALQSAVPRPVPGELVLARPDVR